MARFLCVSLLVLALLALCDGVAKTGSSDSVTLRCIPKIMDRCMNGVALTQHAKKPQEAKNLVKSCDTRAKVGSVTLANFKSNFYACLGSVPASIAGNIMADAHEIGLTYTICLSNSVTNFKKKSPSGATGGIIKQKPLGSGGSSSQC